MLSNIYPNLSKFKITVGRSNLVLEHYQQLGLKFMNGIELESIF